MKYASAFTVLFAFVAGAGCGGGPTATVDFSRTVQPTQPLANEFMQIAVYPSETTGSKEYDQEKWKEMAADMIQYSLQRAAEQHSVPIQLVDREHMKISLAESDMKDAGMTEGAPATSALAGATAIITSKVNVKIDKQKGKGTSIDALSAFGSAWGGGGGVSTREVDEVSRNITVQCQFQLKANDGSNAIIASHTAPWEQHSESAEAGFFFGSSKTEQDMTPRDKVIGAIIEKQLKQFMCKFVPTDVESTVRVEPSGHDGSIAGAEALIAEDWAGALASFEQAIAEDSKDDRSLFGAGVAAEKLDRLPDALRYYKRAASYEDDEPQYTEAIERVKSKMPKKA